MNRRVLWNRNMTDYERLKFARERKRILALFAKPVNYGCSFMELYRMSLQRHTAPPIRRDFGSAA